MGPLEVYARRLNQLRPVTRSALGANLHFGLFTFDEADEFYTTQVGMSPDAARAETVKDSMLPGAALMSLAGTDAIHQLRKQTAAREGAGFNLKHFHGRLLSYGSLPLVLSAREILEGKGGITHKVRTHEHH